MTVKIQIHGSGMEVGRSCIGVDNDLLLDCGILMSEELDPAPADFFPRVGNPSKIRNIFITHAHLDHSGYLPFIIDSGFRGGVYCVRPTKELLKVLLIDSLKLAKGPWADLDESIIDRAMDMMIPVDYEEEIAVPGGTIQFIKSHHILGAAMVYLEKGGRRVLFTSDYNMGGTRCFKGARDEVKRHEELKEVDALFLESTYGDTVRPPRGERERYLIHATSQSLDQGRRVFLPCFALGRAQELQKIYLANRSLVPYANVHVDGMIREMNRIYARHERFLDSDFPLAFREVHQSVRDQVLNDPHGIVITTSGFCQGGPIRFYLDNASAGDTIIFSTSFFPRGTMADKIRTERAYGETPLNVEEVDLSAHSSFADSKEFAEAIRPKVVYTLHGDPVPEKFLAFQLGGYPVVNDQRIVI